MNISFLARQRKNALVPERQYFITVITIAELICHIIVQLNESKIDF